jgi:hypothetical protein
MVRTCTWRRGLPAVLMVAELASIGCGEGADPQAETPAAPAVNACDLLTSQDAEQVLGEPANWMSSVLSEAQGGDPRQCGYNAGSDTTRTISLEVRRSASADQARQRFDAARELLAGAQDVQGLAEEAFWLGRGVEQLHVLRGDSHLIVTSHPGPERDAMAAARTVAERAIARLGS